MYMFVIPPLRDECRICYYLFHNNIIISIPPVHCAAAVCQNFAKIISEEWRKTFIWNDNYKSYNISHRPTWPPMLYDSSSIVQIHPYGTKITPAICILTKHAIRNLLYKSHQIPKLKCFSSGLAAVFVQSIEACRRCSNMTIFDGLTLCHVILSKQRCFMNKYSSRNTTSQGYSLILNLAPDEKCGSIFHLFHYNDVIIGTKASPITSLAIVYSTFFQAQIKENIKYPRYWPLWGEFTDDRWIPPQRTSNAENVSIWWRHHVCVHHKHKRGLLQKINWDHSS